MRSHPCPEHEPISRSPERHASAKQDRSTKSPSIEHPDSIPAARPSELLRAVKLLEFDLELLAWMRGQGGAHPPARLVGFDEAGRGALAGPVVVGCVSFRIPCGDPGSSTAAWPGIDRLAGLDDSKKLSPARRELLYRRMTEPSATPLVVWSAGSATAAEIDTIGVVGATQLAARRAWIKLQRQVASENAEGRPVTDLRLEYGLVFDRNLSLPGLTGQEYLGPASDTAGSLQLFALPDDAHGCDPARLDRYAGLTAVWCTRGDSRSIHVAGASVIAKVTRDRIMRRLSDAYPGYGWAKNMGYGTKKHRDALQSLGASPQHRLCFRGT